MTFDHPDPIYAVWTHVIASARAELVQALRSGLAPPLDAYAAESDVELFAVATEWFFERPHDLRAGMSAIYDLLSAFYRQDPAARVGVHPAER